MVQWLRLHASTAAGVGLILGQETKMLRDVAKERKNMNSVLGQWGEFDF